MSTRKQTGQWWRGEVIYQIYVRSFCDSNGDGIGDLPGVTSKLGYLKQLGIDAIWLSPISVSANADWGYDVTDYYAVDPALGTMDDFEHLVKSAAELGIKVLLDLVPNHTSVEHPWFLNAKSSQRSRYRDWYIWADGRKDRFGARHRPNNWRSSFGGSAWKWHAQTKQYFLHNFLPQQADLNWRNPEVIAEFDKIMRFWLDRGAAGFRIDVFNMLIKDRKLRDNPGARKRDSYETRLLGQEPKFTTSRPEVHEILRGWRKLANSYDRPKLLLGEATLVFSRRMLASFYGKQDELNLVFNFTFLKARLEAGRIRSVVEQTEVSMGDKDWPVWAASNHDQPRFPSRWAGGDPQRTKLALLMMLTIKGTPVLYYGDELGMTNVYVPLWKLKDPVGKRFWPLFDGRDKARTPMLWNNQSDHGFGSTDPWLPFGQSRSSVADQQGDENSVWHFTQKLLKLRKHHTELHTGPYYHLTGDRWLWVWRRGVAIVIAINTGSRHRRVDVSQGRVLLSTLPERTGETISGTYTLQPWEGVIITLKV